VQPSPLLYFFEYAPAIQETLTQKGALTEKDYLQPKRRLKSSKASLWQFRTSIGAAFKIKNEGCCRPPFRLFLLSFHLLTAL
jgi:hypothetical protein